MYSLDAGERLSESMRPMILAALEDGLKSNVTADKSMIKALVSNHSAELYAAGYEACLKLPEKYRTQKTVIILAAKCLQHLENRQAEYDALLVEFSKLNPGDPCIDLLSVPYFKKHKQHEKVLEAIRAVDRWCGGDLYLMWMEGDYLFDIRRYDEAAKLAAKLRVGAPNEEHGYTLSVVLALREKKWNTVTETMKAQVQALNEPLDLQAVEENSYYAEYVKTKEYGEFKKWQAARKK
jgi:hypothetical protein